MSCDHRNAPRTVAAVCAAVLLSFSAITQGQDKKLNWNRFRGPNGNGTAAEARIPVTFGPTSNVLWKTAIGAGQSSPVIWGSRVFLTTYDPKTERKLATVCIDRTDGAILWSQVVPGARKARRHSMTTPAAPTPAADAKHVYAYFATYGLICYDHTGKNDWECKWPAPRNHFGMSTSPILHGDNVIMVLDDNGGKSRVLAVSRETGKTVWTQSRVMCRAGWSTPMIWRHDKAEELIVLGYKRLTSYNPSTGEEIWWAGGFSEETIGTPVSGDGLLFVSAAAVGGRGEKTRDVAKTWKVTVERFDRNKDNQIQRDEMTKGFRIPLRLELDPGNPGYGLPISDMDALMRWFDKDKNKIISEAEWFRIMTGFTAQSRPCLLAVRPGATRDARTSHIAWEIQKSIPETPSLLYHDRKLYLLQDGGILTCLTAATGKELFRQRIGASGHYVASPIVAGDKIVTASAKGVVTIIQAADKLNVLARNAFKEKIHATPAIADNTIYLRTAGHLYALGQAKRVRD